MSASNLILPESYRQSGNLTIRYGHARNRDSGQWESALLVEREGTHRTAGPVGMHDAYRFESDDYAVNRCREMADHLYGADGYTTSELYRMVSLVTESLIDLLHMPPPNPRTKAEMERAMEEHGAFIRMGEEVLLDAR